MCEVETVRSASGQPNQSELRTSGMPIPNIRRRQPLPSNPSALGQCSIGSWCRLFRAILKEGEVSVGDNGQVFHGEEGVFLYIYRSFTLADEIERHQ